MIRCPVLVLPLLNANGAYVCGSASSYVSEPVGAALVPLAGADSTRVEVKFAVLLESVTQYRLDSVVAKWRYIWY